MKKLLAAVTAFILSFSFATFASADEPQGVFVPNYKAFMESFTDKVRLIDSGFADAIIEDCYAEGEWQSPSGSINNVYYWEIDPQLRIYERSDYLSSLYITLDKDEMKDSEDIFIKLMLAAATSIIPNTDATFEQTLFENIYYDYVKDSPAGYITMYWNCGVYLFEFNKSSDEYTFEISLSLYEVE